MTMGAPDILDTALMRSAQDGCMEKSSKSPHILAYLLESNHPMMKKSDPIVNASFSHPTLRKAFSQITGGENVQSDTTLQTSMKATSNSFGIENYSPCC